MTEIDVPDWVVEAALLASFRVACEHTGTEFSEDEFRNARDEHDRENRNVASDMMRAALTAALGAWVVPVYQIRSQVQRSWVEVKPDSYALILSDNDDEFYEGRILYALRQEKPE